jgi:hypothetical protein
MSKAGANENRAKWSPFRLYKNIKAGGLEK